MGYLLLLPYIVFTHVALREGVRVGNEEQTIGTGPGGKKKVGRWETVARWRGRGEG